MKYPGAMVACWWALVGMATAEVTAPAVVAPRIAVVSDDADKDLAALVVTELSSNPAVVLVERDDLAKVGEEAKLQQLASSDATALGKLVGADGLVFLDRRADGAQVRFTAVNLGYALFDDPVPAGANLAQEAKAIGHLVANDATKLKLDPGRAIPISVLNLRADFATEKSAQVERDMTLLLESRLAAVPEYVVLERRHAWSLGFEHGLDPQAQPLLRGAYLIDGTLSLGAAGSCTATVRIRNPSGKETTETVQGQADHLPDFAAQILAVIQKSIGGVTSPPPVDSREEAQEYLREGIWGRHANALDAGLEALDSAELLGAPIANVEMERIPVLYSMADQGMGNWFPLFDSEDKTPAYDAAELDRRAGIAIRALQEAARYESEKMEGQVDPALMTDPTEKFMASTGNLEAWTIYRASKVLYLLDRAQAPRADELRQALRPVTDYDPLHGHMGRATPTNVNNDNSRAQFADNWAQSMEEELAYYRLVCQDQTMSLPFSTVDWNVDRFCARFLPKPEDRHKAFADFVESLKDKPDSRMTYCLLRTYSEDPAMADAGYKDFLGELWNMREDLAAAKTDRPLFHNLYPLPDQVKFRNAEEGLPLLHYLLTSPKIDSWSIGVLRMLWQPRGFSAADAPQLWTEFKACRDLMNTRWKAEGYGQGAWDEQMGGMADDFRTKFPEITGALSVAATPEPDSLMVTKFWNPGQVASSTKKNFMIVSSEVSADGIWMKGVFTYGDDPLALYHVNLGNFTTEMTPAPPMQRSASNLATTSSATYLWVSPGTDPNANGLARYDLKSGTWQVRQMPGLDQPRLYSANDELYLFVVSPDRETSVARYDWDADKLTILTSNRRRPAQNQFDDAAPIVFFGGIFAGPGHRPCFYILPGTYYMSEKEGAWPEVFDGTFGIEMHTVGDRTLVCSSNGEAVMLDANATAPEYWVANSTPHFRKPPVNGQPQVQVATPWAAQANWIIPSDKRPPWQIGIGFHDETLFILEEPKAGEPFHLLCYRKGTPTPVRIPLQFHMDEATRAQISYVPDTGSDLVQLSIDQLEHPEKVPMQRMHLYPQLVSTHQGLCLQYTFNGFWFIPFADLDAYLKAHPIPAAGAQGK